MADAAATLAAELSANPQPLVDGFKKAEQATGAWADATAKLTQKAQLSINGVDFSAVTSKAKAEQIKLIELNQRLAVAQASGSKAVAAGLQEEIALLQKVQQLRRAGFSATDATAAAKASVEAIAKARETAERNEAAKKKTERFGGDIPKAVEGIFDRSRLAVFEEGGAKIPVFGGALEELGPAGLIAAGGLAAASIAAEHVKQAMEFADEVQNLSKELGLTTTQLQAFDAAAVATGVGQDKARESIKSFGAEFAKFAEGLDRPQEAQYFKALGFTPESARQVGDVGDALEKTLKAIAELPNANQRASFAKQLGLENFAPLLGEGTEGIEKFVAAARNAKETGEIISPSQIAQAAELNDKVEALQHRIGIEFKAAFIDLAPAVEKGFEFLERVSRAVADIIGKLPDAVRGFVDLANSFGRLITNNPFGALLKDADKFLSGIRGVGLDHPLGPIGDFAGQQFDHLVARGKAAQYKDQIAEAFKPGAKVDFSAAQDKKPTLPPVDLSRFAPQKKGPEDQTAGLDKAAKDQRDQAATALATAQAALIANILAHAEAEKQAATKATDKRLDDIQAEEVKVRQSKNDAHRRQQLALLDTAKQDELAALEARKQLIDRQAEDASVAAARAQEDIEAQIRARIVQSAQILLTNAQDRAAVELEQFKREQTDATERFRQDQQRLTDRGQQSQDLTNSNVAARVSADRTSLVAERTRQQRAINPLYDRANPTTSIASDLQGIEAKQLDNLTEALTGLLTQTKSVKDAFHDMALGIITDLTKLAVQREIEQPLADLLFKSSSTNNLGNIGQTGGSATIGALLSFLPGHATGSDSFGGGTKIDEDGPEGVAFLPRNTQIIPNETLRGLARLDPSKLGGAGGPMELHVNVDAGGAFSYDHVQNAVRAGVQEAVTLSGVRMAAQNRQQAKQSRNDLSRY